MKIIMRVLLGMGMMISALQACTIDICKDGEVVTVPQGKVRGATVERQNVFTGPIFFAGEFPHGVLILDAPQGQGGASFQESNSSAGMGGQAEIHEDSDSLSADTIHGEIPTAQLDVQSDQQIVRRSYHRKDGRAVTETWEAERDERSQGLLCATETIEYFTLHLREVRDDRGLKVNTDAYFNFEVDLQLEINNGETEAYLFEARQQIQTTEHLQSYTLTERYALE